MSNYDRLLLQELHEAMADVMVQRRQSTTQRQRETAQRAIDVWRKVDLYLRDNRS